MIKFTIPDDNATVQLAVAAALTAIAGGPSLADTMTGAIAGGPSLKEAMTSELDSFKAGAVTVEYANNILLAWRDNWPEASDEINALSAKLADLATGNVAEPAEQQHADVSTTVKPAQAPPPPAAPAPDAKVDSNGVAFNGEYCGEAKEPFIKSGERAGQWKKKRGVDWDKYDAWYASKLPSASTPTESNDQAPDPAAAFGAPAPEPAPAAAPPAAFSEFGPFMGWISEMMAGQRLTQEDVNGAYEACGLTPADVFPPNTPDVIATNIGKLHAYLGGVAGAA